MGAGVLLGLREATRDAHARLEAALDVQQAIATRAGRLALARRFHLLHASVERATAARLEALEALAYAQRRRAALIARCLRELGDPRPPGAPPPVTPPASTPEALGLLYVLEGSTLGGRVIRRQAAAIGQDLTGLGFLDPYGPRTSAMWRGFLAVLAAHCPDGDAAAIAQACRGAVRGFAHAHACLVPQEQAA